VTSNPTSIAQYAAVAAMTGPQEFLNDWVAEFDRRRQVIVKGLNAIPGITCVNPGGAFYVFPNISSLFGKTPKSGGKRIETSDDFADYLLARRVSRSCRGRASARATMCGSRMRPLWQPLKRG
jgi:aspartate aminotransferase